MTDITNQILAENYNPLYEPLPPSYEELVEYEADLTYWEGNLTYEWATNEILSARMGWVRTGLVAERVRRYRLYKGKFPDWKTYCKKVLGKETWQVSKMINGAIALMKLVETGFSILPNCISQMEKLISCCKKGQLLLVDAWSDVIEALPAAHLITGNRICEVLGFPVEHKYNLPRGYYEKIKAIADRDGMSVEEKLDELIFLDTEPEPEPDEPEPDELSELAEFSRKESAWIEDIQQMVRQHDCQIWLLGVLSKLSHYSKQVTQFSWLKNYRESKLLCTA